MCSELPIQRRNLYLLNGSDLHSCNFHSCIPPPPVGGTRGNADLVALTPEAYSVLDVLPDHVGMFINENFTHVDWLLVFSHCILADIVPAVSEPLAPPGALKPGTPGTASGAGRCTGDDGRKGLFIHGGASLI